MEGISAIVATYQRREELKTLLDSMVACRFAPLEVIIVDQNTNNLIDDIIAHYSPLLVLKHLKLNVSNQSLARNHGAREAKYPIICFPDDDCWFDEDSFHKIGAFFIGNPSTDLLIINWRQNESLGKESQKLSKKQIYSFKAPIHYGTIVFVFRKDLFERLGGFNEKIGIGLYIGGGEDAELLFRAARANATMFYDSGIFVNHKFTPLVNRNLRSVRSRQRAIGFIYLKCNVSGFVLARGLLSPFLNMFLCFDRYRAKAHYNTFIGRIEGLVYGLKN